MNDVTRVAYRFSLPAPYIAVLVGEAERCESTPSRVLEDVLAEYLRSFVASRIGRSMDSAAGSREA